MPVIDLFNSEKMEENFVANRKLLMHKGFYLDIDNNYWNFKLNIEIEKQTLFLDPIVFFDNLQERLSYEKTKREIKKL